MLILYLDSPPYSLDPRKANEDLLARVYRLIFPEIQYKGLPRAKLVFDTILRDVGVNFLFFSAGMLRSNSTSTWKFSFVSAFGCKILPVVAGDLQLYRI